MDQVKEFFDKEHSLIQEEEEKWVDEQILAREDINDDEVKELEVKQYKLKFTMNLFFDPEKEFKQKLFDLTKFYVIKYPRVLQSLFYMMCYNREDLCEVNTNKLFWKIAKHHWN